MNLDLPEPLKVHKNIAKELDDLEKAGQNIWSFAGEEIIETIFELDLIKKYQSKCVAIAPRDENIKNRITGLTINIKQKLTTEENLGMQKVFERIAKIVANCAKRGEKIIMIPLSYRKGTTGHANVLVYRGNKGEIEHFEPHGGQFLGDLKTQELIRKRLMIFVNMLNNDLNKSGVPQVKYIEAQQVCPYIRGLQTLEGASTLPKKRNEPSGYCSAWSFFFSELCFKNQQLSSSEIMNDIYNYLSTKPEAKDYLKNVIRGYAGRIVETVNKYLLIFFKGNLTSADILQAYKSYNVKRIHILEDVIRTLANLELKITLDPTFDYKKELKKTMKEYKKLTEGKTKDEQRQMREKDKKLRDLYYKKRILQNFEEYNNTGKITDPVSASLEELEKNKIVNPKILEKGHLNKQEASKLYFEERKEDLKKKEAAIAAPKSVTVKKTSPKAKTKKAKKEVIPETIKKVIPKNKVNLLEEIIKRNNIDMSTEEGRQKLLKIVEDMGKK